MAKHVTLVGAGLSVLKSQILCSIRDVLDQFDTLRLLWLLFSGIHSVFHEAIVEVAQVDPQVVQEVDEKE